jgi:hypothetical protein
MHRGGQHAVSHALDAICIRTMAPHERMHILDELLVMSAECGDTGVAQLALSMGGVHDEARHRAVMVATNHHDAPMVQLLKQPPTARMGGTAH